ncbi:F0F1 ATP synthase subunit epsilon [Acetobacter conturbans]|uniref:F0F1 ATP synthase subunit epsilon n=1 Tax=Acetobacter conturbans TaxID=1737472 RepID=A0ABX0JY68_9PROT|nr:F0F1 ATP synthase subunit epsilon [Acetobacter conturbans]NHN87822.1 F0F1 ATP synthase subunit epsilon [Acetobacter conturbans]
MRVRVITPLTVVADEKGVLSVRAQDESGSFGILKGHADLLTSLVPTVISWKRSDGSERYCAVRHGVLTVKDKGEAVDIATREAVVGDDLASLSTLVRDHFEALEDIGRNANVAAVGLQLAAVRLIAGRLKPGDMGMFQ